MVLVDEPSFTGCLMDVRPVGLLKMIDEKSHDEKWLAVPNRNPRFDSVHTMDQVFPHLRKEIDFNGDGRVDITKYFDEHEEKVREAMDQDFDGKVDSFLYFEKGVNVRT